MLIDTHAHLTDHRFDTDRQAVIIRAKAAGVAKIIEIACEPAYWDKALQLAEDNRDIYCALGLHPQEAKLWNEELSGRLEELSRNSKVCAIGETGLDYYHENSPRNIQKAVFIEQIKLAEITGKPVSIHCRDAYPDLLAILKSHSCCGVIHCFSGNLAQAAELVAMGFYLGIDGPVTYPKSETLKAVVKATSLDRLMLETDCPYLPPQAYRGKRNEPAYAVLIAEEISKLKDIPLDSITETCLNNSLALFKLK